MENLNGCGCLQEFSTSKQFLSDPGIDSMFKQSDQRSVTVQTETRMDGVEEALRAEIDRAHTQVCTQENTLPRLELALFRATDNETYTAWNTSREWKLARPQVKRMRVSKSRRGDASNQRQRWSLMRRSFAVLWRGWLWQNDGVCPVTCKRLFPTRVCDCCSGRDLSAPQHCPTCKLQPRTSSSNSAI